MEKMIRMYRRLLVIAVRGRYDYTMDHLHENEIKFLNTYGIDAECQKIYVTIDKVWNYLYQNGYQFDEEY